MSLPGKAALETGSGRRGAPEDIASLRGFLCSDTNVFITGPTIHVNAGERDF